MKITFSDFEQQIDEPILKRGFDYYKNGHVLDLNEISPGRFEAEVQGSDEYTVMIETDGKDITSYDCDCPYDMGPVCKHLVAVIFAMQDTEFPQTKKTSNKGSATSKVKRSTVEERVNDILDRLSHDELKAYISEECKKDRNFRDLFLSGFSHLVMPESVDMYRKQIRALLNAIAGRQKFIDYQGCITAGKQIMRFLENSRKLAKAKKYLSSVYISLAVLDELTAALGYTDDSSGSYGDCIDVASEILYDISQIELLDNLRKEFFDMCTDRFRKGTFENWDWHITMINIAVNLVKNEEDASVVNGLLIPLNDSESNWFNNQILEAKRELLKKMKGNEAAEKFVEANLENPSFRTMAIDKSIAEKNYKKAIQLAEDGLAADKIRYPGLANQWREHLLSIYMIINDKEKALEYARCLFIDSINDPEVYYRIFKKYIPAMQWEHFVQSLISELKSKGNFRSDLISKIYIWENKWDLLLESVKNDLSFYKIEHYEKYLINDYRDEIVELYEKAVFKFLEYTTGRPGYKTACRYIRKIKKLGSKDKTTRIIATLKAMYPARRALIEELDLV